MQKFLISLILQIAIQNQKLFVPAINPFFGKIITYMQLVLNTITGKIRLRREYLNYTQAYVAGKLGISQNAYSKIESGQTNFSVKRLYEIMQVLDANVVDFIQ